MSKYIDADRLKAEIERYENTAIDAYNPHGEDADFWHGKVVACENLKTFVTSLQQEQPQVADASKMEQPEVDLEKEVRRWKNKHGVVGMDDLWLKFAIHFWNKGYNARKEK